ncbi:MAG: AraC family transcriptional regulator [Pseudomonadota bacterium]
MGYLRDTLLRTPVLVWERVALESPQPAWSDTYRVQSTRLLLPQQGNFECELGGARWTCDARSALALTPGQDYRLRQPDAGQHGMLIVLPGAEPAAGRRELRPAMRMRLALLARAWRAGAADALQVEEGLLQAAWQVLGTAPPGAAHRAVERARDYLARNFHRRDTLAEIGRAACCSPYHLARSFRRGTGSSLHAFRTELRMAEALRRIEAGERDLAALALDLGFSGHSHFGAVFARCYGAPPARLRTKLIT